MCVYVFMWVCMCWGRDSVWVSQNLCVYVFMYVCIHACGYACSVCVCVYVRMYACM